VVAGARGEHLEGQIHQGRRLAEQLRILVAEHFEGFAFPVPLLGTIIGFVHFSEVPVFGFKLLAVFILVNEVKPCLIHPFRQYKTPLGGEVSVGDSGLPPS
jgi:hypothetical protein